VAYIYDGDNIIQEVGRSGNPEVRYTYGPGIDEPLAMQVGRVISYYEADGLGTITSLSGPGGVLRGTYQYDSFGMPKSSTDRANFYRYTARQLDPETGLYYYRARYYDPSIGRFLSEDPIGFGGGVNFYGYVSNNPTGLVDPTGLDSITFGPITIPIPGSRCQQAHWYCYQTMTPGEVVAEDLHEAVHRDQWWAWWGGERNPGWRKEQLAWLAEVDYLTQYLRDLNNMCPTEATRADWEKQVRAITEALQTARENSTEFGAKVYWNESVRKWYQKKVPLPR
jgi:RHS repeat-associated protein